ncbi:hypothetical protein L3Y34_010575 [Caenorhabditis briggsae]|uniref:Uncharacterized protein n=1 Tax=Caenorhabditis briggsae TaxID=6238 RepID=A0AAE8ZLT7_CAEBR|nr:hypothetical protein L3Y34_010575 [Caenorhabditis briggsae]
MTSTIHKMTMMKDQMSTKTWLMFWITVANMTLPKEVQDFMESQFGKVIPMTEEEQSGEVKGFTSKKKLEKLQSIWKGDKLDELFQEN